MSHEFIPKDLRYIDKASSPDRKTKKRRENQKRRRIEKVKKEMIQKEKELQRWSNFVPFEEQFRLEIGWAKAQIEVFMRNTGRVMDITQLHYFIQRRGQKTLDVVAEVTGGRTGWLLLKEGRGHRAGLNKKQLRDICVKLSIKYWDEMSTNQMRAVLILLAWKDQIDPVEDM